MRRGRRSGRAPCGGKRPWKIQRVHIAHRVGDLADLERRPGQKLHGVLQADLLEVRQRRNAEAPLKAAVEPASADARIGGDVVDGDLRGVIVGDELRRALDHIRRGGDLLVSLDQLAEQQVGIAQHLRPAPRRLPARVIDRGDIVLETAAEADRPHGRVRADAALGNEGGGVRPRDAQPVVFPWIVLVGAVADERIRPREKDLPGVDGVGLTAERVCPAARNDIVQQIMVTHTRAPVIAGRTLLKTDIFDYERQTGGAGFVRMLEILRHHAPPVCLIRIF